MTEMKTVTLKGETFEIVDDKARTELFRARKENTEVGEYSHVEGYINSNIAAGIASHGEGRSVEVYGEYGHAEGIGGVVTKTGYAGHAEGIFTESHDRAGHAEGLACKSIGEYSHAEGSSTEAIGSTSHTEGLGTIAASKYQHVQGQFNVTDTEGRYAHIVGNGTLTAVEGGTRRDERNCHTLDWNGNAWYRRKVYVGGTSQDDAKPLITMSDLESGVTLKSPNGKKWSLTVDNSGTLSVKEIV